MTDLVGLYEDYYQRPVRDTLHPLLKRMVSFPEHEWPATSERVRELYENRPKTVRDPNPYTLRSSGSSGKPTQYTMLPYGQTVVDFFEHRGKKLGYDRSVWLNWDYDPYSQRMQPTDWNLISRPVGPYSDVILADWSVRADKLVGWAKQHGRVSLIAAPHTVSALLHSQKMVDLLRSGRARLTSTNSEAFYGNAAPVNDHMFSWKGGLNFFTCVHGGRHFYPMFHLSDRGSLNLLNLLPYCDDSDHVRFGSFSPCLCGRWVTEWEFIPHVAKCPRHPDQSPAVDPTLAARLAGRYKVIQFVQCGEVVHVPFTLFNHGERMPDADIVHVEAVFHGRALEFHPNSAFPTAQENNKLAAFTSAATFSPVPWPSR